MSTADIGEITDAAEMERAFAIRRAVFCNEQGVSAAEEFDGLDAECQRRGHLGHDDLAQSS